ncbi:hypothetical protein P4V60_26320 [Brevibacillus porteri]|uniref:hypothetical protein n=1 Tax=Brevibacillus porteri TaxID=2126350 RepID=UPI002E1D2E2D|nr:hypothetical protein [Brevibacillus porteri]
MNKVTAKPSMISPQGRKSNLVPIFSKNNHLHNTRFDKKEILNAVIPTQKNTPGISRGPLMAV